MAHTADHPPECPLWVISGHSRADTACPLCTRKQRSADVKTSLAIVVATAALMFGAIVGLESGAAFAHPSKGVPSYAQPSPVRILEQVPRHSGPGPYRGQM